LTKYTEATWDSVSPLRELIRQHIRQVVVHRDRIAFALADRDKPFSIEASIVRGSGETRIAAPLQDWP
jgi:hypothetical protein